MHRPPECLEVWLLTPSGRQRGYRVGEQHWLSVEGEDTPIDGVTGWEPVVEADG